MKSKLWVTAVAAIHLAGFSSVAHSQENQPATDELKLLRRKIEELEQKVRELEQKTAPVTTNKTTDSQVQELEQKVKVLERNRELDQEAAGPRQKHRRPGFAPEGLRSKPLPDTAFSRLTAPDSSPMEPDWRPHQRASTPNILRPRDESSREIVLNRA